MNNYPLPKKIQFSEVFFGTVLDDPYHWIRNAEDPEVLAWVAGENEYTDRWFNTDELNAKIEELKAQKVLGEYTNISGWKDGYVGCQQDEGDMKIWKLSSTFEKEELLYHKGSIENYTPFFFIPCPSDESYYILVGAYDGDMIASPKLFNAETGEEIASFHDFFWPVWSSVNAKFYYPLPVLSDVSGESRIQYHCYDVLSGEDSIVLEAEGVIGEPSVSSDSRSLIFEVWKDYTVSFFYSYNEETGRITDITQGHASQMKYADTIDGIHYFICKDNAERGEIIAIADGKTLSNAEVILPESEMTLTIAFAIGKRLFALASENASSRLIEIRPEGAVRVDLPGEIYTLGINGREKDRVFLKYESFTEASSLLAFDGDSCETLYRGRESSYPDVTVDQFTAASSSDGTEIPYFVVHRKDVVLDGSNPAYMYAYGGYNMSMNPWAFDMVTDLDIAGWVNNGGIYVLASIRGGSEFGAKWHEMGMLMNKKNCYADFISVAEKLIADGWTSTPKLTIDGCSNGGLLMSALVTMRPDLFGCVIDSVPHTDMIHFAEDDRGPMYITEYGDPKGSKEMFEYFLSYSPYHNIREENYPCVYIQTGECDNNVPPYHGKKFAAKMQELSKSDNPILLRVLAKGAHDRGTGEVYWKTVAEMQLFAEKAMGLR